MVNHDNTPIYMGGASVHNMSHQPVEYVHYVAGDHSVIQHMTSYSHTDSDDLKRKFDEPYLEDLQQ